MGKLPNVKGRITYISSREKQENLYAVYETTDRHYWTELAKCSRQEFKKSGTEGKCIEAREFIIALPESFQSLYEPDKLLKLFTDRFKEKYGAECISALHHNKRKTNYHIHLIFSERERLPEPIEKTATRNMFYDERGKHVRTRKEILDENGNIRKGCKIVQKGEVYERTLFTAKNALFRQDGFVDDVKLFYTDLINLLIKDDKEKLHVFDKNGLYLATKKIGKNNPKAAQIRTDNENRMRWNCEVDRAMVSGVAETEIRKIKQEYITERIKESVSVFGNKPERFGSIIMAAVTELTLLIYKVLRKARELSAKRFETEPVPPPISETQIPKMRATDNLSEPTEATQITKRITPQIPPRPTMPPDAAPYPRLYKVYEELNQQNGFVFDAERERSILEMGLDDLKGFSRFTKKGELQRKIDSLNKRIDILKAKLSDIVQKNGFQTVHDFYRTYSVAANAYADYREKADKWDKTYGGKKTMEERLRDYQKSADGQVLQNTFDKNRGTR